MIPSCAVHGPTAEYDYALDVPDLGHGILDNAAEADSINENDEALEHGTDYASDSDSGSTESVSAEGPGKAFDNISIAILDTA